MASVSVPEFFRQARSTVSDSEGARFGDIDALIADTVTCLFEQMAESEVERRLGARLYERSPARQGHRNGSRRRRAQLSFTTVTIRIPRLREEGFVPSFLERNRRAISTTERWVERAFLCGISRAEVIRLLEGATGCRPSEPLLRRVQAQLDERVQQFRSRPLTGSYEYLFLDAAWVKDIVGMNARRICILTAVGVTTDGKKEILGFARAQRECAASWTRFLQELMARGLCHCVSSGTLRLVISDEHEGIKKAVEDTLGDVRHQLCWAHRCRNLFEAVSKADRKEMAQSLRRIYQADHRTGALAAFREFKRQWSGGYPSLVANTEVDLAHLLAFLDCPELHREYVRTSNPIERVFVELRRARFGCGAFANRESCDRVVGGVYMRLNEGWQGTDIWYERRQRRQRRKRKEAQSGQTCSSFPCTDPVSGARVAPQQSPILPDGWEKGLAMPRPTPA